jgi:hypothetical protein
MYREIAGLDKTCKPKILSFLCKIFNCVDFQHSFHDQFISWTIWDGVLSIRLDLRNEMQKNLLNSTPIYFKGTPQQRTLKIVNENTIYIRLKDLIKIDYPNIIECKLLSKNKEKCDAGDSFYSYNWEVFLDDNSSIFHYNQKEKCDIRKGDFIYDKIIQERAFVSFLECA